MKITNVKYTILNCQTGQEFEVNEIGWIKVAKILSIVAVAGLFLFTTFRRFI